MDFEYTFWQMLFLCFNPRRIYRTALYHSRTKHQWARDDPAFVVTLLYLLLVATLSWLVAFGQHSIAGVFRLFLYTVVVDFLGVGCLLATIGWWTANTYLREGQGGEIAPAWSPAGGGAPGKPPRPRPGRDGN